MISRSKLILLIFSIIVYLNICGNIYAQQRVYVPETVYEQKVILVPKTVYRPYRVVLVPDDQLPILPEINVVVPKQNLNLNLKLKLKYIFRRN